MSGRDKVMQWPLWEEVGCLEPDRNGFTCCEDDYVGTGDEMSVAADGPCPVCLAGIAASKLEDDATAFRARYALAVASGEGSSG